MSAWEKRVCAVFLVILLVGTWLWHLGFYVGFGTGVLFAVALLGRPAHIEGETR